MLNKLALFVAILISVVSGVISVWGLTSIFAAAFIPVVVMGGVLETAKIVVATWCHRYWNQLSHWMKSYLSIAIIILMAITSMGVYGFLAKAHIDQNVSMASDPSMKRFAVVTTEIKSNENKIVDVDSQLKPLNDNINILTRKSTEKLAETGQTKGARSDLAEAKGDLNGMRKERDGLVKKKDELTTSLNNLKTEKIQLEANVKKLEAEVGAIRYIAALFSEGEATPEQLEKAVRWMIVLLVLVFDPLAIVMIVAASNQILIESQKSRPEPVKPVVNHNVVNIPPGKKIVFRTAKYNRRVDPAPETARNQRRVDKKKHKRGRVLNLSNTKI